MSASDNHLIGKLVRRSAKQVGRLSVRALGSMDRFVRTPLRSVILPESSTLLVLQYGPALGYCVHNTPLYEAIKRQRPDLRIVVGTHRLGGSVLQHNPWVDHIAVTAAPSRDFWDALRGIRALLRGLDAPISATLLDASNAGHRLGMLALLTSTGLRVGYSSSPALLHQHLVYDQTRSLIENNLRILCPLGLRAEHVEPAVFFSPEDARFAVEIRQRVAGETRGLAILVTRGSGGQRTAWHDSRFAEVAAYLRRRDMEVVYVGVESDARSIDRLRALAGSGVSVAGQTNIGQLAALLCEADLVVSIDTGTMHIARSVGAPMVVLGPSWQRPTEWLPLDVPMVRIVRGRDTDLGPPGPPGYQLDDVHVPDVLRAIDDLVRTFPASREARQARRIASLVDGTSKRRPRLSVSANARV